MHLVPALVVALASLVFALSAQAQVLEFRPAAGVVVPAGRVAGSASESSSGPGVTAHLRFQPSRSVIGLETGAFLGWLNDVNGQTIKHGGASAGLVLRRPSGSSGARVSPFVTLGAGLYAGDCRCIDGSFVGWGGYLGAGTDLKVGPVPLFLEARLNRVFVNAGNNIWLIPVVMGVRI